MNMGVNNLKRLFLFFLIVLSGCTGSTEEPTETMTETTAPAVQSYPDEAVVDLKNIQFSPSEVTIAAGGTVVWKNSDLPKHTVTFEDYSFDMTIEKGEETKRTFSSPGVYDYYCSIHPSMTGRVTVK
jgi:plastocyanin